MRFPFFSVQQNRNLHQHTETDRMLRRFICMKIFPIQKNSRIPEYDYACFYEVRNDENHCMRNAYIQSSLYIF